MEIGEDREAEDGLRRREDELLGLPRVQRDSAGAASDRIGDRKAADQQAPLIHLRGEQGPQRRVLVAAQGQHRRDQQLRRFRRDRRQPLHEEELVDPQLPPALHQRRGEGARRREHERRGAEHQPDHRGAPRPPGQIADAFRDADELGRLLLSSRCPPQVREEDAQQHHRVVPGDAAREGDDERVDAGGAEEPQLHPAPLPQDDAGRALPAAPRTEDEEQDHEGPSQPEQEPVAARHVGGGVMGVLGSVASAPGEEQVDGVLGKDGDDGEDGRGQAARDVMVRCLRGPDEQEGRGDHRGSEDGDRGEGRELHAEQAQEEGGQRNRQGERDLEHWNIFHSPCSHGSRPSVVAMPPSAAATKSRAGWSSGPTSGAP